MKIANESAYMRGRLHSISFRFSTLWL